MAVSISHDRFSLKEAAVLARLSEEKVRSEIERKIIDPDPVPAGNAHRLVFAGAALLYFSWLRYVSATMKPEPEMRRRVVRLIKCSWSRIREREANERGVTEFGAAATLHKLSGDIDAAWKREITPIITCNWDAIVEEAASRASLYNRGKEQVTSDERIFGGEPVFAGTRLPVRHIGGLRLKGEPLERIRDDYPELTPEDIEFAELFTEANPLLGRPKAAEHGL